MAKSASRREQLQAQRLAAAKKERQQRIVIAVVGVVVLALIIAVAVWGVNQARQPAQGGGEVPEIALADSSGLAVNLTPPASGAKTLDIYSDYQCPSCRTFDLTLHSVLDEAVASDQIDVRVHLRSFLDTNLLNDSSRQASIAATCAAMNGTQTFWDFHNEIFTNQPAVEGDGYEESVLRETIPAEVGMTGDTLTTFQSCYDNAETGAFVDGMEDAAARTEYNSTPVYLVDGVQVNADIWDAKTSSPDASAMRELLGL
ncbi:MAG: DsbA family protein [Propionibacteriaceae bacterium]|jgi:protein-disulfide isomerase|nr:DsbA family protein [Propionibacteriaceae bacterium]